MSTENAIDLQAIVRDAQIHDVLERLDRELIGLAPVKARIAETAAFLVV